MAVSKFIESLAENVAKHSTKLNIGIGLGAGFKFGEDIMKPYKYGVARPLTAALTAIRESDNMSMRQAWDLGWQQSGHVSPGQAFVGAIGALAPGLQAADKLDWSNSTDVDNFFKRDSVAAKRISGSIDFVSNVFLDPLVIGGKAVKLTRLAATGMRGVSKKGFFRLGSDNMSALVDEVDSAVAGKRNAAGVVMDAITEYKDDLATLESLPIVARSTNPTAVARVFSAAAATGDRGVLGTVIKAGLGHADSIDQLRALQQPIADRVSEINSRLFGSTDSIKVQMSNLNKKIAPYLDKPSLTPWQLKRKESIEKELLDLNEERLALRGEKKTLSKYYDIYSNVTGGEETIAGMVGRELAWSRNKFIEHLRAKGAEVQGRGWYFDIRPEDDPLLYKAFAKSANGANRAVRMVGFFTPSYKSREIPAGAVTITGDAGLAASNEFRARLIQAARNAGMTAREQRDIYTSFARLGTDSARFNYLEKFEFDAMHRMLRKEFDLTGLSRRQLEAIDGAIVQIIEDVRAGKLNVMKKIISDNDYVHIDQKNGESILFVDLMNKVQELAQRIAGDGEKVLPSHINAAKEVISRNPAYRTQVPNVHYGINFDELARVLRDDKSLVTSIVHHVRNDPEASRDSVRNILLSAKDTPMGSRLPQADRGKEVVGKFVDRYLVDSYENFQNYIWKPSVLLSLRYTSRNTMENWMREAGSIVDMVSHYGYNLTSLIKSTVGGPLAVATPIASGVTRAAAGIRRSKATSAAKAIGRRQMENDTDVERTFRIYDTAPSGDKIAVAVRDRYLEEGEHFFEQAKDVLTASIEGANQAFYFLKGYKGHSGLTAVTRRIGAIGNDIWTLKDSTKFSTPLAEALRMGAYESALRIARESDPKLVYATLEEFTNRILKARGDIKAALRGTKVKGNPILSNKLDELDDYLELTLDNLDVTKAAFTNRISLRNDMRNVMQIIDSVPEKRYAFSTRRVKVGEVDGMPVSMGPTFANVLRRDAVSSASSTSRAVLGARRRTFARLFSAGSRQTLIHSSPNDVEQQSLWAMAHAEHVRNVLHGDEIGRMFIEMSVTQRDKANPVIAATVAEMKANGVSRSRISAYLKGNYSDDEITQHAMNWLDSRESVRWKREQATTLGDYRDTVGKAQYADLVDVIRGDVNKYLPHSGPSGEDYGHLRMALRDGNYSAALSSEIPESFRASVYGNREFSEVNLQTMMRNLVGNLFHLLATLPEDAFARHPFYNAVYRAEGERLASLYERQGKDINDYIKEIENSAHAAAQKAVMDRLYSIERHTNFGHAMRFLSPFYMAGQNSTKFWLGTAVRNPDVAVRFIQAYSMPYRLGMVQNREEDYLGVEGAQTPWSVRGHVMVMDYPKWMRDKFFAGDTRVKLEIPISGFDVAFQGQIPGVPQIGGPVGTVFLGAIVRNMVGKDYDPSKYTEKYFGKSFNEMVQYVQPYYEPTRGSSIQGQIANSFGQSSVAVESALVGLMAMSGSFDNVTTGTRFANRVDAIMQDELTKLAMNDTPITGALVEQTRERAISLAIKSFFAEALYAASPLVTTGRFRTETQVKAQPELRRLQKQHGYDLGSAIFADQMDTRYGTFIAKLLTDSNTDNRFNFNSTDKTLNNIYQHEKIIGRADTMVTDKSLLGLFINEGDWNEDYSPVASDMMYNVTINGKPLKYSAEDRFTSQKDTAIRTAWREYYQGIDQIESDAKSKGIRPGTNAYDEYYGLWKDKWTALMEKKYPMWGAAERQMRMNRVELNLAAATLFVQNPQYMAKTGGTISEVQGIQAYLTARKWLMQELEAAKAASGNETISAEANQYVAAMRDDVVNEIDKKYPGFRRVFDIYFNGDKLNSIDKYMAGYSYGSE